MGGDEVAVMVESRDGFMDDFFAEVGVAVGESETEGVTIITLSSRWRTYEK